MNTMSEVIASRIMALIKSNEQAAWDAILKLIKENKQLKAELKALKSKGVT